MLKKAGVVVAAAVGLSMLAGPAIASAAPADDPGSDIINPNGPLETPYPTFGNAFNTWIQGGGALGYGAAALVAGAYSGIATTPALIAHSFTCGADC